MQLLRATEHVLQLEVHNLHWLSIPKYAVFVHVRTHLELLVPKSIKKLLTQDRHVVAWPAHVAQGFEHAKHYALNA